MERTKALIPPYRVHKGSGQGYVNLDGERVYLGKADDSATKKKYDRTVAEWLSAGRRRPVAADDLTVVELSTRFVRWSIGYYRNPDGSPSSHAMNFKAAIKPLLALYETTAVKDFGPVQLKAVRQKFIDGKLSRCGVNRGVGMIRRVFKWGVGEGLVNVNIHTALLVVEGLRTGRTEAPETEPVRPVPDAHIDAVRPYVSRQVWGMIQLQLLTAARAGEIVTMRAINIDTTSKVWTYSPTTHKGTWRGQSRTIYLGPKAQEVVKPFLMGRAVDSFLFSPREAETERRAACKTHRRQPVEPPKTDRELGERYDVGSYRRAIHRACDKAKIPRWGVHRIRHNSATKLRREHGIDIAQTILGHRLGSGITEIYAEANVDRARDIIAKVG